MSDQSLYRYFNSGDILGAVGVIPAHEDGEYTFLPSRSAGQCCPWILTVDLHETPQAAEQAPLARFQWGDAGTGLRDGVLSTVVTSRQPAAVLQPSADDFPDTQAMLALLEQRLDAYTLEQTLALLEQRLDAYTLEQTLARLHSYGDEGPSVDEFVAGFGNSAPAKQN